MCAAAKPAGGKHRRSNYRKLCAACGASGRALLASYPDRTGRPGRLCSRHAKEAGTHRVRNPCTVCSLLLGPRGDASHVLQASFPDAQGRADRLCGRHAREAGTHRVRNPCSACTASCTGRVFQASFPDGEGRPARLCSEHARQVGTYSPRNACVLCPSEPGLANQASFPGSEGQPDRLCSFHARREGTYRVRRRCTHVSEAHGRCPAGGTGPKEQALCTVHRPGYRKAAAGRSRIACLFFDELLARTGVRAQHAHYGGEEDGGGQLCSQEHRVPEVGQRFGTKVDGFDARTGTVYEFHGDFWHGNPALYRPDAWNPVTKCTMGELWATTADRMDRLRAAGYTVRFVWESEFRAWRRKQEGELPLHLWYQRGGTY